MRNESIIKADIAARLESIEALVGEKKPKEYPDHVRPEVRAAWDSRVDPTITNSTRQQRRCAERLAAKRKRAA